MPIIADMIFDTVFFFFFPVLGIRPKDPCTLDKHSITERLVISSFKLKIAL